MISRRHRLQALGLVPRRIVKIFPNQDLHRTLSPHSAASAKHQSPPYQPHRALQLKGSAGISCSRASDLGFNLRLLHSHPSCWAVGGVRARASRRSTSCPLIVSVSGQQNARRFPSCTGLRAIEYLASKDRGGARQMVAPY